MALKPNVGVDAAARLIALQTEIATVQKERDDARREVILMAQSLVGAKCQHHTWPLDVLEYLAIRECPICWKLCAQEAEHQLKALQADRSGRLIALRDQWREEASVFHQFAPYGVALKICADQLDGLITALPQPECERWFPVTPPQTSEQANRSGPSPSRIPWSVAEKAYSVYQGRYGRGQSIERVAERGGFYATELDDLFPGWREEASEITRLRGLITALLRPQREEQTEDTVSRVDGKCDVPPTGSTAKIASGCAPTFTKNPDGDWVCEHGTASDVHCCGCHSGFLFDSRKCICF